MNITDSFTFDLPPGAVLRGRLFRNPDHRYGTGDVLEVELPDGLMIDLGWDGDESDPFHIVVYRESYGDRFIDFRAPDPETAADDVAILLDQWARTTIQPVH